MTTSPRIGYFDREKYGTLIKSIYEEKNKSIKENFYKEIAKDIILSEAITDIIIEGPSVRQLQGVPFDLIGLKGNDIYIIELKGSEQGQNFPKEVQLVRMEKLIIQAKKENIELKPMLLQLNLKYCFYCLWPADFLLNCFRLTDKKLGSAKLIEPIIEWIEEYLLSIKNA